MTDIETGVIYCDDNLWRLAQLPAASVDLAYLDPPFFSNRRYEVIWGDEAEVRSFEDRWAGGIEVYVDWMRERLIEIYRILKPTGSLYLHCDPTASAHLHVMLDSVFGRGNFRSEIVWKRSSAHSDTKQGRRQHGRIHDVILFYTKGSTWTWNPVYQPYDPAYVAKFYRHVEPGTNRRFTLSDITAPGGADPSKRNPHYEFMGVTRYWRYGRDTMERLAAEGRIVQSARGKVPRQKRYLDEMPGVPLQDLWTDIQPVSAQGAERMGFPTQKPVALLKRILETSSNPGDIVLDAFCGCGSTLVAAESTRPTRRWIGIDISPTAVELMRRRLEAMGVTAKLVGMPDSEAMLRTLKPFEFQNWIIQKLGGTHAPRKSGDLGVDGYWFFTHDPIQVKQSDSVGRNVVDNFEAAIERNGKQKGYLVGFDFTRGAAEEVARVKRTREIEIVLLPVRDILDEDRARRDKVTAGSGPRPADTQPTAEEVRQRVISDLAASSTEPEPSPKAPRSPRTSTRDRTGPLPSRES